MHALPASLGPAETFISTVPDGISSKPTKSSQSLKMIWHLENLIFAVMCTKVSNQDLLAVSSTAVGIVEGLLRH